MVSVDTGVECVECVENVSRMCRECVETVSRMCRECVESVEPGLNVEHTDLRTRSDDAGAQIGLRRRGCAALSRTRVTQLVAQGGRTLFNLLSSKSAYYT